MVGEEIEPPAQSFQFETNPWIPNIPGPKDALH